MTTIQHFTSMQVTRLKEMGRMRTSETYQATLKSFTNFCQDQPLPIQRFDNDTAERYEAWLKQRHISRNSSSFYMRVLRRIYNLAVEEGLTKQGNPFRQVYTGIDKTSKRAVPERIVRRIKNLDLSNSRPLDFARDMFIMSFYLRGMSFIDMAYLRKQDLRNGYVTYTRRKTGQQLTIRWEPPMQAIVDKWPTPTTQYLLPIVLREDGTERRQYLTKQISINRYLKVIGSRLSLTMPLTMYVARHSWATIAYRRNIPVALISGALGHDSEDTTRIYLGSIQTNRIDEANRRIIRAL